MNSSISPRQQGAIKANEFIARLDATRAKCDPERGWKRGPGGKCVRVKPKEGEASDGNRVALIGAATFALGMGGGAAAAFAVAKKRSEKIGAAAGEVSSQSSSLQNESKNLSSLADRIAGEIQKAKDEYLSASEKSSKVATPLLPAEPESSKRLREAQSSAAEALGTAKATENESNQVQSTLSAAKKKLEESSQQLKALQGAAESQKKKESTLTEQASSLSKLLEEHQLTLSNLEKTANQSTAENSKLRGGLIDAQRARDVLSQEVKDSKKALGAAQSELQSANSALEKTRAELASVTEKLKKAEDALLIYPVPSPSTKKFGAGLTRRGLDPSDANPAQRQRSLKRSLANAQERLANLRKEQGRTDSQSRAKCDPERGWKRGPGGKCVRVKPKSDDGPSRKAKAVAIGTAAFTLGIGGGAAAALAVIKSQSSADKGQSIALKTTAEQAQSAAQKTSNSIDSIKQSIESVKQKQGSADELVGTATQKKESAQNDQKDLGRDKRAEQERQRLRDEENQAEIDRLERKKKKAEDRTAATQEEVQKKKAELDGVQGELSQRQSDLKKAGSDLEQHSKKTAELSANVDALSKKVQAREQQIASLESTIQKAAASKADTEKKTKEAQQAAQVLQSELDDAKKELAATQANTEEVRKTIAKTQAAIESASQKRKAAEDALLVNPIPSPSAKKSSMPRPLDPEQVSKDQRSGSLRRSFKNAERRLQVIRGGAADETRRAIVTAPKKAIDQVPKAAQKSAEIARNIADTPAPGDTELREAVRRIEESAAKGEDIARRYEKAVAKRVGRFVESNQSKSEKREEAQRLIEQIEDVTLARLGEKRRGFTNQIIENVVGPNAAFLWRTAQGDKRMAKRMIRWADEFESSGGTPATRREFLARSRNRIVQEIARTDKNYRSAEEFFQDVINEGQLGWEVASGKLTRGGRSTLTTAGEWAEASRSSLSPIERMDPRIIGKKVPRGTFLRKGGGIGPFRTKARFEQRPNSKRLAFRILKGLFNMDSYSDPKASRLQNDLKCSPSRAASLIEGTVRLDAKEIGTLRAIHGLPAIFDADDNGSSIVLLGHYRKDAARPKCDPDHGWKRGSGGKCVRTKPKESSKRRSILPPPPPVQSPQGYKAARGVLIGGALVGAAVGGAGLYAATRPLPDRDPPPDIGPGRPAKAKSPTAAQPSAAQKKAAKQQAKAQKQAVNPANTGQQGAPEQVDSRVDQEARSTILKNAPKNSVHRMVAQSLSTGDYTQGVREALNDSIDKAGGGNFREGAATFNQYKAKLIAGGLSRESGPDGKPSPLNTFLKDHAAPRGRKVSSVLTHENYAAIAAAGSSNPAAQQNQRTVIDFAKKAKAKGAINSEAVSSLAREAAFVKKQLSSDDLERMAPVASFDARLEQDMRSQGFASRFSRLTEGQKSDALNSGNLGRGQHFFYKTDDFRRANPLSKSAEATLFAYNEAKYNTGHPNHKKVRELLEQAPRLIQEASAISADEKTRQTKRIYDDLFNLSMNVNPGGNGGGLAGGDPNPPRGPSPNSNRGARASAWNRQDAQLREILDRTEQEYGIDKRMDAAVGATRMQFLARREREAALASGDVRRAAALEAVAKKRPKRLGN